MKRTLSILFSILSLSIMAQVPQGVGYQGVATDANTLLSGYFNYYGSISGCSPTCFPKNLKAPIFVDENTLLTAGSGNDITFNGYLMDK